MASEFKSLTFHEWEKLFFQEQSDEPEIMIESIEEAVETAEALPEEPIWESQEPETEVEVEETNGALEKLKNLCRVCSSHGLISISSQLTPKLFSMRPSGDMKLWQISIANILSEVSGEKIEVDDGLPQFICQHCLGYLQHAYAMRLRIRQNMASLMMMKTLATEESIELDQKIDITRVTKREVDEIKEEQNEEGHFYKVFGKANIHINSGGGQNRTSTDRIMEHKCCGCGARLMSIKNLNTHTQNCEHIAINNFFTALKELYSHRESQKLTKVEFIHHAFRLIFDTTKHMQKISKAKGINVNAVTSEMPQINMENYQYDTRVNNLKRNFKTKSPDNGYASGGSPNYNQRF